MRQTLFFIPNEIPGLPGVEVFGAGLLLGLWLLGSVVLMAVLARRQGFNADTLSYIPLLVIVAAAIRWGLPMILDEQGRGFPIRGYGVGMLVAVLAATGLTAWRARRAGVDPDAILTLAFFMFVPGVIGARIFFMAMYWAEQFQPIYESAGLPGLAANFVRIDQGGLVVYGGILGALPGFLLFVRVYRFPPLALCDLVAPSLFLALAFGRIGCLMNGCCYGGTCDHDYSLAVTFPQESPAYHTQVRRGQVYGFSLSGNRESPPVLLSVDPDSELARAGWKKGDRLRAISGHKVETNSAAHRILHEQFRRDLPLILEAEGRSPLAIPAARQTPRSLPVHPTQIYSSINGLLLCLLLLAYDPFRRRDGELFALAISVYPIARFLLEMIRTDESHVLGTGMSISQNVSLALLLGAAGFWCYILRQPRGTVWGNCP